MEELQIVEDITIHLFLHILIVKVHADILFVERIKIVCENIIIAWIATLEHIVIKYMDAKIGEDLNLEILHL